MINEKTTIPNSVNHKADHNYKNSYIEVRLGKTSQRFELKHGECGQDE